MSIPRKVTTIKEMYSIVPLLSPMTFSYVVGQSNDQTREFVITNKTTNSDLVISITSPIFITVFPLKQFIIPSGKIAKFSISMNDTEAKKLLLLNKDLTDKFRIQISPTFDGTIMVVD